MKDLEVFKEKAIQMRKNHMSLPEICKSLNLGKTTVYYWIKDVEAVITRRPGPAVSGAKTRKKAAERRQRAYDEGVEEYPALSKNPLFRDFLILYLCEGYKKNRNVVALTNSDVDIIKLGWAVLKKITSKSPSCMVQIHLDNSPDDVTKYWAEQLGIDPCSIKVYTRKVSMTNRNGRLPNGIFMFRFSDTYLRSRMQAWLDILKKEWSEHRDLNPNRHVPNVARYQVTPCSD
jgi:hypothetical protein